MPKLSTIIKALHERTLQVINSIFPRLFELPQEIDSLPTTSLTSSGRKRSLPINNDKTPSAENLQVTKKARVDNVEKAPTNETTGSSVTIAKPASQTLAPYQKLATIFEKPAEPTFSSEAKIRLTHEMNLLLKNKEQIFRSIKKQHSFDLTNTKPGYNAHLPALATKLRTSFEHLDELAQINLLENERLLAKCDDQIEQINTCLVQLKIDDCNLPWQLNCGSCYLTRFPKTVLTQEENKAFWSQLTILDLSFNFIQQLPSEIGKLTALKILKLNDNQLQSIPAEIGNLLALEKLYLSFNQLRTLPLTVVQLGELKSLILYGNKLTTLPLALGNMTKLMELDVSKNELTFLPLSIARLNALNSLKANHNQLENLPSGLWQLKNLHELCLSNNHLRELPTTIGGLIHVKKLSLANNQLQDIPAEIGKLVELEELELDDNQIKTLPDAIQTLRKLLILKLNRNQLEHVPSGLYTLRNLSYLGFNNNLLKVIPEEMTNLYCLTYLGLAYNQLTRIPEGITRLPQLWMLELQGNMLEALPEFSPATLSRLQYLFVTQNHLRSLPEKCTNILRLYEEKKMICNGQEVAFTETKFLTKDEALQAQKPKTEVRQLRFAHA